MPAWLLPLNDKVTVLALSEISSTVPGSPSLEASHQSFSLDHWILSDKAECVSAMYDVIVKSQMMESFNEAISLLLQLGKKRFEVEHALLAKPVSETVSEIQAFYSDAENTFYVGQHISVAEFLCHSVIQSGEQFDMPSVAANGDVISPVAYAGLTPRSYFANSLSPHFADQAVVCFFSQHARQKNMSQEDAQILNLIGDGISYLMDQQKTQVQRRTTDSSMFASGSASTLEEYVEQASIPELYGIPGRVVDVLKKRIGESSLSIGNVAEELNLSKRTLQRRLQQQSVNFAELRDQVRYHYSIDYLVKNRKSIDTISIALDFSDRTSFTNAFKRWTGMSPSTFRKLFRDYV